MRRNRPLYESTRDSEPGPDPGGGKGGTPTDDPPPWTRGEETEG